MEIVYTHHARRRMAERSISETVVETVLAAPDLTYPDGNEMVAERILAGKAWRVVYAEEPAQTGWLLRVVTVHRIRGLKSR